ncbi:MAG: TIGR04282 family arsenosugar biosynthesis glycosyltransferase [Hyphomicrobiales bacterium]|nr:TIGR04282 family arsenosugar biosynthesis glycosyltransferase [Hyphomicrobiales bacterium]
MQNKGIAICVMCKPPRVGISKTRLAAEIGAQNAASLAAAFLLDVAAVVLEAVATNSAQPYAFFTPPDARDEIRGLMPEPWTLLAVREADVGATMHSAICTLLQDGHSGVIIIGADLPTVPLSIITQAIQMLVALEADAIIGPSEDGGYYLIGLKAPCSALFGEMPWSTPDVFGITVERAQAAGLSLKRLPVWHDVDDAASLARLREELASTPPDCAAHTRRALAGISA